MNGIRVVHQDTLRLNDSQGLSSIVTFIKNKRRFSEHGYKCGEVYVMPPFNGESVVLCVHGQVPFLEIYARRLDVEKHEPVKLMDLLDTDVNVVDSCTFELKKVGQKRWRLRAENSLKRDKWIECIRNVQKSCESELALDDQTQTSSLTEDFRALLSSNTMPRERKDSSESNLYSADPVRVSQPLPFPKSPPLLIPSRSFNEDMWRQSPRSVTSVRSLPEGSSPRPIRTRKTILDMPINAGGLSSTLNSPPRAFSCPQSPQSPAPSFGRLDFGKGKKFADKPIIPLPSLPEINNDSGVDMVETSREFKSNRNSNSSSSNRDSMNSKNSNQENDPHELKPDIYGYYGLFRNTAFNNNQIYDNSLTDVANENSKQVNLVLSFCTESLKMVKAFGKIWIVGWEPKLQRLVGGILHYGDHLAAINGKPVNSNSDLMDLFCGCPMGIPVRLTINPTPFGQSFVLRKPNKGKLPLGVELHKNKNRIESILPGSVASMAGLPAKMGSFLIQEEQVPSIITEVEDHPLDPSSRDSEALQKMDAIPLGQSFTVIVHPRDFIKVLKTESKSIK
ncbi:unnamed protein product [Bursaphelenchus xylophilus]|uniref:(pine wood nematode) hypothetical protein n=1 Tax=Bursaphelenchus xylophilus TaxID=6326 RepID=A0A1I7SLN9_BURXY|nr:unnamed protein product [Bursaphelenchus xylophilus]CAG9129687.1 unnamed protein product [Bursaphelenchus xylophilus]